MKSTTSLPLIVLVLIIGGVAAFLHGDLDYVFSAGKSVAGSFEPLMPRRYCRLDYGDSTYRSAVTGAQHSLGMMAGTAGITPLGAFAVCPDVGQHGPGHGGVVAIYLSVAPHGFDAARNTRQQLIDRAYAMGTAQNGHAVPGATFEAVEKDDEGVYFDIKDAAGGIGVIAMTTVAGLPVLASFTPITTNAVSGPTLHHFAKLNFHKTITANEDWKPR